MCEREREREREREGFGLMEGDERRVSKREREKQI